MKNNILIRGIILIFLLSSIIPITSSYSGYEANKIYTTHIDENGTLSGYVKDTSMNPIGRAKVRVYFHETYEENYTDSSGYYHVTNIPICYCLKNATVSKGGYTTDWVLLAIGENTTYDFVLTPLGTIYVDDDNTEGPWDGSQEHPFQKIQDGIDNASKDGDTVFVYSGTYYENIVVDKSIDLVGEQKESTIIDGIGKKVNIRIEADEVTLQCFSITNSSGTFLDNSGIVVEADGVHISGNTISHHPYNALKIETKNSKITNNVFSFCGCDIEVYNHGCIYVGDSVNVELSYNNIKDNALGLAVVESHNISIFQNNFYRNSLNAYFRYGMDHLLCPINWNENFWDRDRKLPKPIPGGLLLGDEPFYFTVPLIAFDWNPASEPYKMN